MPDTESEPPVRPMINADSLRGQAREAYVDGELERAARLYAALDSYVSSPGSTLPAGWSY